MTWLEFYGFSVAAAKTSISHIRSPWSEFLKTVSLPKSLHGYASWMATGLLYNKPWTHTNWVDFDHNTGWYVDAGFLDPNSHVITAMEMYRRNGSRWIFALALIGYKW